MKINIDNSIKEILLLLNNDGNSYIVGGYVRDKLLGIDSNDVDIATSLLPDKVADILANYNIKNNASSLGCISLYYQGFDIQITTMRKENYDNSDHRHPKSIEYINDIYTDVLRRDITINAIYSDIEGNIIDPLNGLDDISNKTIRMVINPDISFVQDSLRILRVIRFACKLDFNIEELYNSIINNINLVKTIPLVKAGSEIKGIIECKYINRYKDITNLILNNIFNYQYQLHSLDYQFNTLPVRCAYIFSNESNEVIKFTFKALGYSDKLCKQCILIKDIINKYPDSLDIIGQKTLASYRLDKSIYDDLSLIYNIDIYDLCDHIQRMKQAITVSNLRVKSSDLSKASVDPHYYNETLQFLLEQVYLDKVHNNKDDLLQYIKDNRLDLKRFLNNKKTIQ